jgi:hypothetical protein
VLATFKGIGWSGLLSATSIASRRDTVPVPVAAVLVAIVVVVIVGVAIGVRTATAAATGADVDGDTNGASDAVAASCGDTFMRAADTNAGDGDGADGADACNSSGSGAVLPPRMTGDMAAVFVDAPNTEASDFFADSSVPATEEL